MDEYKKYRRKQIAELADWEPGFDMTGVSVSDADRTAGSPKPGDKIARNPANHADRWLVAADYFAANFDSCRHSEQGWVSVKERMPPDSERVLVWCAGEVVTRFRLTGNWFDKYYGQMSGPYTHWMPLPPATAEKG